MKTEHLKEFVVLAHHLSFTVAAEKLFIAQSTLSSHISQLENELGFELFERKAGVHLTVAGSMFLEKAQDAIDLLDAATEHCRKLVRTDTQLRVACQGVHSKLVQRLKEELGTRFVLVYHDYQEPFFSMFDNNEADLLINYDYRPFPALCREARRLGLACRETAGAPASITLSCDHPLAAKLHLTREDLRGATIVVNSAPDYERWKTTVTTILGNDLGLSFELEPIGDLNNLALFDHGSRLHVCGREINEQYFGHRADVKTIESIDGIDLSIPQVAVWRADTNPEMLGYIEAFCTCWDDSYRKE